MYHYCLPFSTAIITNTCNFENSKCRLPYHYSNEYGFPRSHPILLLLLEQQTWIYHGATHFLFPSSKQSSTKKPTDQSIRCNTQAQLQGPFIILHWLSQSLLAANLFLSGLLVFLVYTLRTKSTSKQCCDGSRLSTEKPSFKVTTETLTVSNS